ncbi:glutamic acid-rich protein-like [Onthophagus taurus]|uniref:glutamic acid-rich protein-like n=1 Tax=Onthophagus taurus TaxID=166361 RepID=UPI0039BDBF22
MNPQKDPNRPNQKPKEEVDKKKDKKKHSTNAASSEKPQYSNPNRKEEQNQRKIKIADKLKPPTFTKASKYIPQPLKTVDVENSIKCYRSKRPPSSNFWARTINNIYQTDNEVDINFESKNQPQEPKPSTSKDVVDTLSSKEESKHIPNIHTNIKSKHHKWYKSEKTTMADQQVVIDNICKAYEAASSSNKQKIKEREAREKEIKKREAKEKKMMEREAKERKMKEREMNAFPSNSVASGSKAYEVPLGMGLFGPTTAEEKKEKSSKSSKNDSFWKQSGCLDPQRLTIPKTTYIQLRNKLDKEPLYQVIYGRVLINIYSDEELGRVNEYYHRYLTDLFTNKDVPYH